MSVDSEHTYTQQSHEDRLCPACTKLNIHRFYPLYQRHLDTDDREGPGFTCVAQLSFSNIAENKSCPLCRLFCADLERSDNYQSVGLDANNYGKVSVRGYDNVTMKSHR